MTLAYPFGFKIIHVYAQSGDRQRFVNMVCSVTSRDRIADVVQETNRAYEKLESVVLVDPDTGRELLRLKPDDYRRDDTVLVDALQAYVRPQV